MPIHTTVKQIPSGEWAVIGLPRGEVLVTYPTERAAKRAIADDKTPAELAAAFGDANYAASKIAYSHEDEVVRRFQANLPLSRADVRLAKRLLHSRKH